MSDARERLIDAARQHPMGTPEAHLTQFLTCPDDLIACLVESGALERYGEALRFGGDHIPLYRRTEGKP